uniref:Uncharacterized protein n=1 Tax=Arundo donax TaxID=35708 RepID=A0A0A9GWD5_ARUDO
MNKGKIFKLAKGFRGRAKNWARFSSWRRDLEEGRRIA